MVTKNYAKSWREKLKLKQIDYSDFVTKYPRPDGYFLEKIDGEIGAIVFSPKQEIFLQSMTGKEKTNLPALDQVKLVLENIGIEECILIAEVVGVKGNRILPFNQSQSIIKKHYQSANRDLIYFFLIDVYEIDGKRQNFKDAIKFLSKYFDRRKLTHVNLPIIEKGGLKEFRDLFESLKDKPSREGVVARDIQGKNLKVKYSDSIDVVVIGTGKVGMPAWEKDQVSYLITAFIDKNENYRRSSNIGTGFTHSLREKFFRYMNENRLYESNGEVFIHPDNSFVVEMKFDRYRLTDTTMYEFKNDYYKPISTDNSVTFSSPSFVRFRDDKSPKDPYDVRPEQIVGFQY